MRVLSFLFFCLAIQLTAFSQTNDKKKYDLTGRANDHFMFQFTYDNWTGTPDSIKDYMSGFHRGANVYFMLDKPFRGNQKLSIGFGVGVGTSNIYFKNMRVDVLSINPKLSFTPTDTIKSKKYKLNTAFLELPLELRFSSKPDKPNQSVKAAIGMKVGTLLSVHTKQKDKLLSTGQTIEEGIWKEKSKKYFNSTRLTATARVCYGIFGIYGSYSLTPMFKSGVASQDTRLLQIGLSISGL
jgi:hypothetical protein